MIVILKVIKTSLVTIATKDDMGTLSFLHLLLPLLGFLSTITVTPRLGAAGDCKFKS